jgi:acetoin:2,6-dichlorophenolindophenol oxidoreductase subunit alpha
MGSLWKLPVVYVCENNGYAITTSVAASHAQPSIYKRADAYCIPGVEVDGQNVGAVFDAATAAVSRARHGQGPTLIEARTYRFDEHQVGLFIAGKPYRPLEEVAEHKSNCDPIQLFRQAMMSADFSAAELHAIECEVDAAVSEAIRFAEESPQPNPSDLYDQLYSQPAAPPARSA